MQLFTVQKHRYRYTQTHVHIHNYTLHQSTHVHTRKHIHIHPYIQAAKAQRLAEIRAKVAALVTDAIKLYNEEKFSDAEDAAKSALELDPGNERGWRELAMCRQGMRASTAKVCKCIDCLEVYVCMYIYMYMYMYIYIYM
jgi:hypothetical protein